MNFTHRFSKMILMIGMVLMMLGLPISASASAVKNTNQPDIDATTGLAIDANTGQILYSKNINKPMALASMSKLLSLYIVRKAIAAGKISWDQKVPITAALHKLSVDTTYANAPLAEGKHYTVRQIYQASFESANAAMMSLANLVGGSTQNFTLMMRKTAKQLGIKDAKLYTACGLTNGEVGKSLGMPNANDNDENKMSARDMATIAQRFIKQFPDVLKNTSVSEYTLGGKTLRNGDYMLPGGSEYDSQFPVQGLKTGTSTTCGGSFIGTTNRDGHRIITVVMHASNTMPTDPGRFIQTKKIMNYVYSNYRYVNVAADSTTAYQKVAVPSGSDTSVKVKTERKFNYWIPRDKNGSNVRLAINNNVKDGSGIKAPVKVNQQIGKLVFNDFKTMDDKTLSVPIAASATVSQANIFVRFWRGLVNLF
ncbi:D-alanyl-D-alanine carboxypeptidase family protein [Lactobacillus sp. Sy-1]|uniref:D-alanyl-D-alanine carboxypeptidase family protein n=1 Tax=Lactobacillus sp. Sy-1 TaxID=2109645 RepID=UPI001C56BE0D|nr:D-alanyl-D-alanine carboxypeptidase family protein [Lactobacillus sp. Sy-1]MBW1604829.1 D-alanyl-D-alanine carboxypeptidase [Lactobacillus sp. Sy-1]